MPVAGASVSRAVGFQYWPVLRLAVVVAVLQVPLLGQESLMSTSNYLLNHRSQRSHFPGHPQNTCGIARAMLAVAGAELSIGLVEPGLTRQADCSFGSCSPPLRVRSESRAVE